MINLERVRELNNQKYSKGIVLYWMQREHRVNDNWSLIYAQEIAEKNKVPLVVAFSLTSNFLGATLRQYDFMIKGLVEVEENLSKLNIPFFLLDGSPDETIQKFISENNVGQLVTDFNPLKIKKEWNNSILERINIPFHEVDSHNIVPVWVTSDKQEFAARTIRPKINSKLDVFLEEFPSLKPQKVSYDNKIKMIDWDNLIQNLNVDKSVKPVTWIDSGEESAKKILDKFVKEKLKTYAYNHSNPNYDNESNLSPYLHFGQISSQRIALKIKKSKINVTSEDAFLEQLIVRKELTDNFCYYNENYDSEKGFPDWAKHNFEAHKNDKREYIYSVSNFENAETHDEFWNAAQLEMVKKGKMHNYMRMYWAKKILEWTKSPEEALKIAIYLNDKYELDGRDPNGYVGIMWSIGGVHDRPWFERDIFGKIRYMAASGLERKFDMKRYIEYVKNIS